MPLVSGFLGLLTAIDGAAVTEVAVPGYARQPVSFSTPRAGASVSETAYDFGPLQVQPVVGRALFTTPGAGAFSCLLIMPHARPRPPAGPSADRGEAGYLHLVLSALAAFPDGQAYSGSFAAGASLGWCYDRDEEIGWSSTAPNIVSGITVFPRNGMFLQVSASPLTAGATLTIASGVLSVA